jgi:hypothetical protein
MGIRI